jgi:hypothetical protein
VCVRIFEPAIEGDAAVCHVKFGHCNAMEELFEFDDLHEKVKKINILDEPEGEISDLGKKSKP